MLKMKTTKTRSITMFLCALALMMVMYNCKDDDKPLPDKPDQGIVEEMEDIKIPEVPVTPPEEVETTEASVEPSAKATELNGALGDIASSGTVPASVSDASEEVGAAITPAELSILSSVTPEVIDAVKEGGEIPAEVKAALDKAASSPVVQAYLPQFTFPTVDGVAIEARVIAPQKSSTTSEATVEDQIEAIQEASDVCVAAAEATFQAKKAELDASKSAKDAEIAAAYNTAVGSLAAQEAECKAAIPATFATYRTAIETQVTKALADLEAAKTILGPIYPILKALINIQALNAYSNLNALEAASLNACSARTAAATVNAQAARDANLAASKAAYDTTLAAAAEVRAKLIESCHNQGGGN